jgi:hypothetical protein
MASSPIPMRPSRRRLRRWAILMAACRALKAPRGVVGSTGFGNGVKSGSNAGSMGKVASAGIPGGTLACCRMVDTVRQKVASAGNSSRGEPTPAMAATAPGVEDYSSGAVEPCEPEYTSEARSSRFRATWFSGDDHDRRDRWWCTTSFTVWAMDWMNLPCGRRQRTSSSRQRRMDSRSELHDEHHHQIPDRLAIKRSRNPGDTPAASPLSPYERQVKAARARNEKNSP